MNRIILHVLLFLCIEYIASGKSDEDCLPGSLDSLNLLSLLKESTKTSTCLAEARKVFTRKYENATFILKGPFITNEESGIDESKPFIVELNHYESMRNIVKTFGHMIRSISMTFKYMDEAKGGKIVGDINDNCTKSLLQIELNDCYGTVLSKLKNSYPNVYTVSLSTDIYHDIKNTTLKLSEIFPQTTQLKLKISNVNYWNIVGDEFSHLTSLNCQLPNESARPDVESLFKNSPNINSLEISYSSLNMLKAASEFLPNLRKLLLRNFFHDLYNGSQIHFKNVDFLYLESASDSAPIPQNLIFYRIQILFLNLGFDFNDEWIEFFTNQHGNTLEYFHAMADSFTNKQLSAIVDSQPNIVWTMLNSRTPISAASIINFVEKSKRLFRFQLDNPLIDIVDRDLLEEKLEVNWNIDFYYWNLNSVAISVTRLNNITEVDDNAEKSLSAIPILVIACSFIFFLK